MGRINLAAIRVRTRALARIQNGGQAIDSNVSPVWANVLHDIPPAQILVRQQPTRHPKLEIRTKTLPDGKIKSMTKAIEPPRSRHTKPRHIYTPTPIRYEEDDLRAQFFKDHPWELARPRLLVETTGDQHRDADWSKGLKQPGIPVSGESVAQRQLWLLQNIPNITRNESYDIARKEFYALRRQQEVTRRIAIEEAEHYGADFGLSSMSIGMSKEDVAYEEWYAWALEENMKLAQRNASFSGTQLKVEEESLEETAEHEREKGVDSPRIGREVFRAQRESRGEIREL
jgi:small subunit ribosomal protein S23